MQDHNPELRNPPQPEDADILDEPDVSSAKDVARGADAGPVIVESGDSEDSGPFRVKRSRPNAVAPVTASAGPSSAPAEPSSAPVAPRRNRLWHLRGARSG